MLDSAVERVLNAPEWRACHMTPALPESVTLRYAPWPKDPGETVQFRLVYKGLLPSDHKKRSDYAHRIRRALSPQLAELWRTQHVLRQYMKPTANDAEEARTVEPSKWTGPIKAQRMAEKYEHRGYHFLPLIGETTFPWLSTACALDILFLRRDGPGGLIDSGGDIDNRMKVLFDALKMPTIGGFDPKTGPTPEEDPLFILLEDDYLITEVKITSDRLLTPLADSEHKHEVELIIHVRTLLLRSGPIPDMHGELNSAFAS